MNEKSYLLHGTFNFAEIDFELMKQLNSPNFFSLFCIINIKPVPLAPTNNSINISAKHNCDYAKQIQEISESIKSLMEKS